MTIAFELMPLIVAMLVVCVAYTVFGITAFGAALITVPILSHFYPLEFLLPMLVLLDVTTAFALGARFSRDADMSELKWMAPASLAGALLGVTLLVNLPRQATLAVFGLFLLVYGAYSLRRGGTMRQVRRAWSVVAGMGGGVTGTLFGIGGPPYAIYLSRRIADKNVLRATLSNMVLLSVSIRLVVFWASGLIVKDGLIMFALLAPFGLFGLWMGNRLHGRISREGLLRVISLLLLAMGVSILIRLFLV